MKAAGGVDSETTYPYRGEEGICQFDRQHVVAKVSGYVGILKGNQTVLKDAVANVGPIAAALDAASIYFQFYSRGIFDHDHCQNERQHLNHAVTVIGYGIDDATDYWMVKNSWGEGWGDKGYIKIARNQDNMCGIATDASYPLIQNF